MSSIVNPFIYTTLCSTVSLHPSKINNNIRENIKKTLIDTIEKTCYLDYGYISKIYKIDIVKNNSGIIIPEDNSSSVRFSFKFSCKLCHPIEQTQIICKVKQTSNVYVFLEREPITIIVSSKTHINDKVFICDSSDKKIRIRSSGDVLEAGTFVKATIISKKLENGKDIIISIGTLDDIANDDEIKNYYSDMYDTNMTMTDYDTYIGK